MTNSMPAFFLGATKSHCAKRNYFLKIAMQCPHHLHVLNQRANCHQKHMEGTDGRELPISHRREGGKPKTKKIKNTY